MTHKLLYINLIIKELVLTPEELLTYIKNYHPIFWMFKSIWVEPQDDSQLFCFSSIPDSNYPDGIQIKIPNSLFPWAKHDLYKIEKQLKYIIRELEKCQKPI